MNKKEKTEIKTFLDALEKVGTYVPIETKLETPQEFAEEWRKHSTGVARPFILESLTDLYREKLLGVKMKPRNRLTIIL